MKRPIMTLIVSALLIALCASGCADDLQRGDKSSVGEGEVSVSFSVEDLGLTRSQQDEDMESVIGHAYLMFYPSDKSAEENIPLATVRAEVSESDPRTLTFRMPLQLLPDTDYSLIAVANADGYVPDRYGSFSDYLAGWSDSAEDERGDLCLFRAAPIFAEDVESLPMLGGPLNGSAFRYSIQNGAYQVASSLSFRRMVARIDVASIVKDGFILEGASICNWRDAAAVNAETQIGNVRGVLSGSGAESGGVKFIDAEEKSGFRQLQSAIYSFPSVAAESEIGDRESTALIIKAKYADDTQSTYYRVNVGINGNRAEVKANTKYLITIQSVKGRGAATPEEAYSDSEYQLVTSYVEGWDIDGGCAMDDNGNFIVLSRAAVEFDSSHAGNAEVKVLASKGLAWNIEYIPTDEASADAFSIAKVSSSIIISPKGDNTTGKTLTGVCRVSGLTPQGTTLTVDVSIQQKGEEAPDGPVIPWDMPFALVPLNGERVKVDQEARTIEIDGFDPDCFNSFIDVPFQVYAKSDLILETVDVASDMEWPLEGRLSLDPSAGYTYCYETFSSQGNQVVRDKNGNTVGPSVLHASSVSARKELDIIYISVGAMGPDDPAIERKVTLSIPNQSPVTYTLKISPHSAIIDDVIITDGSGNVWMIMDRNIQDNGFPSAIMKCIGRDSEGNKRQAYNYCSNAGLTIPFKYQLEGVAFSETFHQIYCGPLVPFKSRNNTSNGIGTRRSEFLSRYKLNDTNGIQPQFYDDGNIESWVLPTKELLETCCGKMSMSKMRIFLVSEFPAREDGEEIPICCYWPDISYGVKPNENDSYRYGYFITFTGYSPLSPRSLIFTHYDGEKVAPYDWVINEYDDSGLVRLVRPLTTDELEAYKTNYLGYGSEPHRLTICHPDTYESTSLGWLPY